jgi:hypothetical protein
VTPLALANAQAAAISQAYRWACEDYGSDSEEARQTYDELERANRYAHILSLLRE